MSRPNEGPSWSCDRCGAINPPKNLICWRCGGFSSRVLRTEDEIRRAGAAAAAALPPLTPEQIDRIAPLLATHLPTRKLSAA